MPKFIGLDSKQWLWVGGGLVALIVVYYVIKSRSGGAGVSAGGDLGGFGGGVGGSSPVSYAPGAPDTSGDRYQQQLNDLDIQARQEALREQQGMYELAQETNKQQLGLWGAQQNLLFQGAQREQEFQLGYEQEAYKTAQAAQEVVTRSVQGKKKVECPKGMHFVVGADGTPSCQQLGGGGFNFSTITKGIADVVTGVFQGAAAAAPAVTQGALQAYATKRLSSGLGGEANQSQQTGYYTPPVAPPSVRAPKATPYPQGARGDMEKFPTVTI